MKHFKYWLLEHLILLEMTEDEFYQKGGFSTIDRRVFDKIVSMAPNYKPGIIDKLAMPILHWYKKELNKQELINNIELIYSNLLLFSKNSNNPNLKALKTANNIQGLQSFQSHQEFNKFMKSFHDSNTDKSVPSSKIKEALSKLKPYEYDIIFEDDTWLVAEIKTHNASVVFGKDLYKNSSWCTSSRVNREYFDSYTSKSDLYMFINKTNFELNHYYAPLKYEFSDYDNENQITLLNAFKKAHSELSPAFKIIEAESNRLENNPRKLIEKRFETFQISPSAEGLYFILNFPNVSKNTVKEWFNYADQHNVDYLNTPVKIGTIHSNNQPIPVEEHIIFPLIKYLDDPLTLNIIKKTPKKWLSTKNPDDRTPLQYTIVYDQPEIFKFILPYFPIEHLSESEPETKYIPLHYAIDYEQIEMAKLLINADISKKSLIQQCFDKYNALQLAILKRQPEIAEAIINADISKKSIYQLNHDDENALHMAIRYKNLEFAELLINADSSNHSFTQKNKYGRTPLKLAEIKNTPEIIELIKTKTNKYNLETQAERDPKK